MDLNLHVIKHSSIYMFILFLGAIEIIRDTFLANLNFLPPCDIW